MHHAILAVNLMSGWQQLTGRLFTHHISLVRGNQLKCRIGLPAFELLDCHGALKALDMRLQILLQRLLIKSVGIPNWG
jgi:hypothetical protein